MLRSYLKIAWRNLVKSKAYSIINIGGLAMGMAVAMLIGLWIYDEVSYNKQFKNHDRIARVLQNQTFNGEVQTWFSQALQLGPELRRSHGSDFKQVIMSSFGGERLLGYGDKKIQQAGVYAEPGIADMLSLNMLKGSKDGLKDPTSIFISASTAKTFFGNEDPIGKVMKVEIYSVVKVAGVYEDLPYNSDFGYLKFIAPWDLMVQRDNLLTRVNWGNSWFQCFVQIADNAKMDVVSLKIKDAKLKRVMVEDDDARFKPALFLFPMSKWRLYNEFKNGKINGGQIENVWTLGIVGIFVLLLACINFMNLSTARSEKRAKEVGIRKTIGSVRSQLIGQFLSESLLVAFFSLAISLLLVQLTLPLFNELADKKMSLAYSNPLFWFIILGFTIITGLIAGSYPAIYLSSFQPLKVLKGTFRVGKLATVPRKILVVLQFSVSVILIIGTLIVHRQIQFAKSRPVGYDWNRLVSIAANSDILAKHWDVYRDELLRTGVVEEAAVTESPVTDIYVTNSGYTWEGKDPAMNDEFCTMRMSHEFGKTVGWKVLKGRDFSKAFATDSMGIVINEAAAAYMGMKDPVGKNITWNDNGTYKIIGVVKDLVMQSPYNPVKQMLFLLDQKGTNFITVKLKPAVVTSDAIDKIKKVYTRNDTENPFNPSFVDQEYARKFGNEVRIGKLATVFSVLAIIISCLGLFGLSSFVAEQRTKEIGIRKVLGASVPAVWRMLSKDFVILVIVSLLISIPLSYYFMHNWLQNFEYRSPLSWWIFAAAGLGTVLLTLLTISFQAIKAALANPVKSLRSE